MNHEMAIIIATKGVSLFFNNIISGAGSTAIMLGWLLALFKTPIFALPDKFGNSIAVISLSFGSILANTLSKLTST